MSQNGPSDVPPSSSSSELPRLTNGRTKSQASTASSTRDSGISLSDHNRDEESLDAVFIHVTIGFHIFKNLEFILYDL